MAYEIPNMMTVLGIREEYVCTVTKDCYGDHIIAAHKKWVREDCDPDSKLANDIVRMIGWDGDDYDCKLIVPKYRDGIRARYGRYYYKAQGYKQRYA